MSQENDRLRRAHEAARRKRESYGYFTPLQAALLTVIEKVPEDKRQFARFLVYAKKMSPKQQAAAERFLKRAQA